MPTQALDAIDRKILSLLQRDGRMSLADLAQAVGLSPSPCLRPTVTSRGKPGGFARRAPWRKPAHGLRSRGSQWEGGDRDGEAAAIPLGAQRRTRLSPDGDARPTAGVGRDRIERTRYSLL